MFLSCRFGTKSVLGRSSVGPYTLARLHFLCTKYQIYIQILGLVPFFSRKNLKSKSRYKYIYFSLGVKSKYEYTLHYAALENNQRFQKFIKIMAEILLNFDKKNYHYNFGWCRTVKRLQEKYFLQIFVKNGSYISKKHEGLV